ncbi:MAG TPA: polysaccharide biosynthesis C-terminal domain-containing protein [Acidimicrobiales bacterium]|nr:polysaccharide biosynthesis C-terminal domain-containing protein [Acidimicrobiales bacterium]
MKRSRFVRQTAVTSVMRVTSALTSMAAGIVVARELGAAGRGTLSVLVALGTVAVLFGSFGIHYSGIYFLGRLPDEIDRILSNMVVVSAVGGLLTAGVLTACVVGAHGVFLGAISFRLFLLFIAVVPCSYFNEFAQRALMGLGRTTAYVVPDLFEGPVLLTGTVASIVVFGPRLVPLVLLRVVVEVSQAVFLGAYLMHVRRFRFLPSFALLRRQVAYGLRNYAGSLLWLFLLRSDLVLCNHFLGRAKTGVYSVSASLVMPLNLLVATMSVLLFQRTSSEASREARIANTNRLVRMVVPLVVATAAVLAVVSHPLVRLLYGSAYSAAAPALVWLIPGVALVTIETLLASFLAGEGSPLVLVWAPLAGLVVNLGANLYAIPHFGIDGAAVTSTIGYALVFVVVTVYYCVSTGTSPRRLLVLKRADLR